MRAAAALVVVTRPSSLGYAIPSAVFDITSDSNALIGVVGPQEKIACYVAPGRHRFMVIAENADFMEADLAAGKAYYAIVTPRMGAMKARFSLHPLRARSSSRRRTSGSGWRRASSWRAPRAERSGPRLPPSCAC